MKKCLTALLLFTFLVIHNQSLAQNHKFRIGLLGGAGILTNQPFETVGASGGMDVEFKVYKKLYFGLETGWASFNNSLDIIGLEANNDLLLPLMLKGRYYFNQTKVSIYGSLGVGVSGFQSDALDLFEKHPFQFGPLIKPGIGVLWKWFSVEFSQNFMNKYQPSHIETKISYDYFQVTLGVNLIFGQKR